MRLGRGGASPAGCRRLRPTWRCRRPWRTAAGRASRERRKRRARGTDPRPRARQSSPSVSTLRACPRPIPLAKQPKKQGTPPLRRNWGARLYLAVLAPAGPFPTASASPRPFCDVLWRSSPMAYPAGDRVFAGSGPRKHRRLCAAPHPACRPATTYPEDRFLASAAATMRPVTWWASRNGIFSTRTSQSARSVAVE